MIFANFFNLSKYSFLLLETIPKPPASTIFAFAKVETLEDAQRVGKMFLEKGVKYIIITLGSKGAAVIGEYFYSQRFLYYK